MTGRTELTWDEGGFLSVDPADWLAGRAEPDGGMTDRWDYWAYCKRDPGVTVAEFLAERFPDATGAYGEGGPMSGCTLNEETWFDDGFSWTYAEILAGAFLFVSPGYWWPAGVQAWRCEGMDSVAMIDFMSGVVVCANCDTGMRLDGPSVWNNDKGTTACKVSGLRNISVDGTDRALCPVCEAGTLRFFA